MIPISVGIHFSKCFALIDYDKQIGIILLWLIHRIQMSAYHIFTTATGPQKPHFCNQGVH